MKNKIKVEESKVNVDIEEDINEEDYSDFRKYQRFFNDQTESGRDLIEYGDSNEIIDQILREYKYFSDESLSNENFYSDLLNNVKKDLGEQSSDSIGGKFVLWLEFLVNKKQ